MEGKGPQQQPAAASILKAAALPPRHISAEHWAELTQESAIPPDLAAINFRSFGDGFTDPELERNALLAEAIARLNPQPGHSYQARMRLAWQYGHLDLGGWRFVGDALPGHEPTPRWKPNQPRIGRDGRVVKYEARPRAEQGLLLPQYSERAWRLVAERHGLPMPADLSIGFWQWVLQTPELPLHPVEGEKKACCLAGLGFAAIGLPGIWMGRRVPEKDGVKRRDLAVLVPELQALAVEGRTFCIAFDRDAKQTTADKVDHAAVTLGHLQRGGTPSALDRILATRFGVGAVRLIEQRRFGQMVSYLKYHVGGVPIAKAVGTLRTVEPDGETVASARSVGISFGDR